LLLLMLTLVRPLGEQVENHWTVVRGIGWADIALKNVAQEL
jgi:hypothetical protein